MNKEASIVATPLSIHAFLLESTFPSEGVHQTKIEDSITALKGFLHSLK